MPPSSPSIAGAWPLLRPLHRASLALFASLPVLPAQEPASQAPVAQEPGEDSPFDDEEGAAYGGFEMESADGRFRLAFRGKIDNDWAFYSADRDVEAVGGDFANGTEFRRARFGLSGRMYDWIRFKASFDFGESGSGFKDIYIEARDVGFLEGVRIGHFKEPFSLEGRTGSSALVFAERATPNALTPGRNVGAMAFDRVLDKNATWAVGFFRETNSDAFGTDVTGGQELAATARVTGLPWYEDRGARLLHVGASASYRNTDEGFERYRARPETHLAPRIVDTDDFAAGSTRVVGAEAALVLDSFSAQAEVITAFVDGPARAPDPEFNGWYAQAAWFLTGERRGYERRYGTFTRVEPASEFAGSSGLGAWEVALRYSQLDLTDGGVFGGELRDLSFGVNWYLNPHARVLANYVISDLETIGNARAFLIRFHVDW